MGDGRVELTGLVRQRVEGAVPRGPVGDDELIEVTVMLRENPSGPHLEDVVADLEEKTLEERAFYSPQQYLANHGATVADVNSVKRFARKFGLNVVDVNRACRTVRLRGTASQFNKAFGVELEQQVVAQDGKLHTFHTHRGPVRVDADLAAIATGVYGLDSRPFARPQFRRQTAQPRAGSVSYDAPQLATGYEYPTGVKGAVMGIIELGGVDVQSDLVAYCKRLNLPVPRIVRVNVDGANPQPDPNGADVEVALDIDVAAGMAPGLTIVIYNAPNTEQGFIDALMAAANDDVNKPTAISISWGAPEVYWTKAGMNGMNQAALAGCSKGRTFFAATGDNGAPDGVNDGKFHVDHPASAPYIVACGGLNTTLKADNTIAAERVWGGQGSSNGAGGGVSGQFGVPGYQSSNGIKPVGSNPAGLVGRGLPDLSSNADPATGYNVTCHGRTFPVGGTSASAPALAALFALGAAQRGKGFGPLQSLLYPAALKGKNKGVVDVTVGNNGDGTDNGYPAKSGYDLASGLGSPRGTRLLADLATVVPMPSVRLSGKRTGRPAPEAGLA